MSPSRLPSSPAHFYAYRYVEPRDRYIASLHRYIAPLHRVRAPLLRDIASLYRVSGPLHQYVVSLHRVSAPLTRVIASLHRYIAPLHRVSASLHRVTLPLHRVTLPLHRYIASLTRVNAPLHRYIAPLHRYIAPLHRYIAPLHRYIAPSYRYIKPMYRYVAPLYRVIGPRTQRISVVLGLHHEEAQRALEESREFYLRLAERINLVRLRWLEGRIAFGAGRLDEAEIALREARDAFTERGIGFDAALVSLHLAAVYAKKGDTGEMKRLAAEMVPIFESRELHPEALAALAIFRQAAEAEEVTLGLLDRMTTYLQRARRNPEMRFERGLLEP
jgi:hypothetical protein